MSLRSLTATALLLGAAAALAQPRSAPPETFGDAGRGHFGDASQGHFGDPSQGEFLRHNFDRSREGQVPVLPGTPSRFQPPPAPPRQRATERAVTPTPEPYFMLQRPLD